MTDVVANNKVVLFHYVLKDSEGVELDSSGDAPQPYLHGANNIPPGLESVLDGKTAGDAFQVTVPPAEGFGEYQEGAEQEIPKDQFPDDAELEPGVQFFLEAQGGQVMPVWITEVNDATVKFDPNHPFAGKTLHFEGQVTRVREATADELDHGHPHGPDGDEDHHH